MADRGLAAGVDELEASGDLATLTPVLSGVEVMELLDLEPGPEVGAAISILQERRFDDGPLDRAGEIAFLKERYSR